MLTPMSIIRESISLVRENKLYFSLGFLIFLAVLSLLVFRLGLGTVTAGKDKMPAAAQSAPAPPAVSGPQVLFNQCLALSRAGKNKLALDACQKVVYLGSSARGKDAAELEKLGLKAALESHKLLVSLGRLEEATETLAWAGRKSPASRPAATD